MVKTTIFNVPCNYRSVAKRLRHWSLTPAFVCSNHTAAAIIVYIKEVIDINTKTIGNIGEAKTLCKFIEMGVPTYIPFGDNEKSDFIADFNGRLNKIQVKTSIKAENGKYIIDLTSSTSHLKNGNKHKYTFEEIDYFALYNITRDKVLLISVDQAPSTAITIRYEHPQGCNQHGHWFEDDLLLEKVIVN